MFLNKGSVCMTIIPILWRLHRHAWVSKAYVSKTWRNISNDVITNAESSQAPWSNKSLDLWQYSPVWMRAAPRYFGMGFEGELGELGFGLFRDSWLVTVFAVFALFCILVSRLCLAETLAWTSTYSNWQTLTFNSTTKLWLLKVFKVSLVSYVSTY